MALTARQRNRLPNSAFAYPSKRTFPVPTRAQARRAGISERQRLGLHRNAVARAAQRHTHGSKSHVSRVVGQRSHVGGHHARVSGGYRGRRAGGAGSMGGRRRRR